MLGAETLQGLGDTLALALVHDKPSQGSGQRGGRGRVSYLLTTLPTRCSVAAPRVSTKSCERIRRPGAAHELATAVRASLPRLEDSG